MEGEEILCQGLCWPGSMDNFYRPIGCEADTTDMDPELLRLMNYDYVPHEARVISTSWDGWSPEQVQAARAAIAAEQKESQNVPDTRPGPYSEAREPISGALFKDFRMYTRLAGGGFKFWGVLDYRESRDEFWARHDPDNKRKGARPEEHEQGAASTSLARDQQHPKSPLKARPIRHQESSNVNADHKIKKRPKKTPSAKKNNLRKSLASKIGEGNQAVMAQSQQSRNSASLSEEKAQSPEPAQAAQPQKASGRKGLTRQAHITENESNISEKLPSRQS